VRKRMHAKTRHHDALVLAVDSCCVYVATCSVRGDDKTFASESVKLEFSARGQAPMARAARQREEVVLDCGADGTRRMIVHLPSSPAHSP
jgi:hypothetical protein